jgi:5'-nucleotidase
LNSIGLDVSGVGNHEFDEGVDELLRMRYGNQRGGDGCHPVDGCQDGTPYGGSLFPYLAANVFYLGTDTTILPPYEVRKVGNAKIAFIGLRAPRRSSRRPPSRGSSSDPRCRPPTRW